LKLPFVKETWSVVGQAVAVSVFLLYGGLHWGNRWVVLAGIGALAVAALLLNFFRDFERSPAGPLKPKEVLSPADGKVVILRTVREETYLKKNCVQVAIFMNPLDNHVQRAPFDGKVVRKEYYPGKFLAAYEDKADLVNEQAHLLVNLKSPARGKMLVKQIAGFLARRVKTTPEKGGSIERGKRIGRILLGSRVDVFLPRGFKSAVKLGDKVTAGVTVLGELP
jgi:phosphatidylserine decarboxylase